jgi:hypothetical protein
LSPPVFIDRGWAVAGKNAVDSRYSHTDGGTFDVIVSGSPASLAADILATGFAGDQAAWKSFFGANYPNLPETALIQITAGAAASGFVRVASDGVTFATRPIQATQTVTLFCHDLSKYRLQTADAVLTVEW